MDDPAALDTYRTLRAGMVAAGILLGLGLIGYIVGSGWRVPGSISATFYTDVRSIFVSTLLAVGLALVAVKGRQGLENTLLDVAGVLIPVVAFVPTPIADPTCASARDCVPPDLHPAIALAMGAYLGMGLVGLVVAWGRLAWAARTHTPWTVSSVRGMVALTALLAVYTGAFLFARPFFIQYAHYTSAITFFLLLVIAVWINSRNPPGATALGSMSALAYRRVYRIIAIAMVAAVGIGVVVFAATGSQNAVVGDRFPAVFWIEVVLLALFVTYWVFQTIELWYVTQPPTP
ncbi:MAG: hypothetical protein QM779_04830 [Propionicimonas sp.]|uniref:hypothetical protein n=1 Tax=Propionicimonas sp. TaxID=1955623 RepID=UPI003D0DC3EE